MIEGLKLANLALAFILELCMLAALGLWGAVVGHELAFKIALAIGTPLVAAVLWGLFMAPRAAMAVPEPWHTLLTIAFFGIAVAALTIAGHPRLGALFAILVVVNLVLAAVWRQ